MTQPVSVKGRGDDFVVFVGGWRVATRRTFRGALSYASSRFA